MIRRNSRASSEGVFRASSACLMRFDKKQGPGGGETKKEDQQQEAPPKKPKFLELPTSMQPVKLDATFTSFPLPKHDELMGFGAPNTSGGSLEYAEAPEALRAQRQLLQQPKPRPGAAMMEAEELGDAMFFGAEEEDATGSAEAAVGSTEESTEEFASAVVADASAGSHPPMPAQGEFHDPTGKVKVHPWRPNLYQADLTQERPDVIQRPSGRNLTMPDLVARWKACREYRDERKLVLSDFKLNLRQYTNAEIQEFLGVLSASFDPGKNLELWQFQKQADNRNSGNSDSAQMYADTFLYQLYEMFDTVEELLVVDQAERLVADPACASKILSTLGHLKILDKVGNWTYDFRLVQGLGIHCGSVQNVVHKNDTGHKIFDMVVDLLESDWAAESRAEWSLKEVVDLFASLVRAETPNYKPVPSSLLSGVPQLVLGKIESLEDQALKAKSEGDVELEAELFRQLEEGISEFVLSCSLLPRHGLSVLSCYDGSDITSQPGQAAGSSDMQRVPTSSIVSETNFNKHPHNRVTEQYDPQWAPSQHHAGPQILARAYKLTHPSPELLVALSTQRPLRCKDLVGVYTRLVNNNHKSKAAKSDHPKLPAGAKSVTKKGDQDPTSSSNLPEFLRPVDPTLYHDESVVWSAREQVLVDEMRSISERQESLRKDPALAWMDTLKAFPSPMSEKVLAAGGAYASDSVMDPVPLVHKTQLNKQLLMSVDFEDLGPTLVRAFESAKKLLPTYATSLERVRSWDKAYIIHSSCCRKETDQIIQVVRALEGGKVGAILSTQTLLTIHQRAVTSTEWIVRESNKAALRILMDELTSGATASGAESNLLLVPFSEEITVAGNQGDWFDEDALSWLLAQHLITKVISVAPVMLMDRLEAAQEAHNCFRGDVDGNADFATRATKFKNSLGALGRTNVADTAITVADSRRKVTSAALRLKVTVLQFPKIGGTHFNSKAQSGDRFNMYNEFNSYSKGRQWKFAMQSDKNYKDTKYQLGEGGSQIEGRSRQSADNFGRHGIMAIPGHSGSSSRGGTNEAWSVPEE